MTTSPDEITVEQLKGLLGYEDNTTEDFIYYDDESDYFDFEKAYESGYLIAKRVSDGRLFSFEYFKNNQGIEFDTNIGQEVRETKELVSVYTNLY